MEVPHDALSPAVSCFRTLHFDESTSPQTDSRESVKIDTAFPTGSLTDDLQLARLLQQQELMLYSMVHTTDSGVAGTDDMNDEELARRLQAEEDLFTVDSAGGMEEHLAAAPDVDALQYEDLQTLGDAVGTVSRGFTADVLQCLPSQPYNTLPSPVNMLDRCCICQDEFGGNDDVTLLPGCRHVYHKACISEWLARQKACPYCNQEVELKKQ